MAKDISAESLERRTGLLKDQVRLVKRKDSSRYEIIPIQDPLSFEKGFFIVIRACQLLAQNNDGIILVGLAGPSGAGKTVFTEKILNFMPSIAVISMDNYNDASRIVDGNFDDPRLTDYDTLLQNVHDLKAGKPVEVPIYDFKTSSRIGYRTVEVPSSRIVIIEGIYALSEKLRPLLDLRVSVTGGVHFDLVKRVIRDIQRAGQEPQEIIHQISETVYPMYKAFIEPDLKTAHIKITNKFNPFTGFQSPTYILKSARKVTVDQIKTVFLSEDYVESMEETYDIYLLPPGEDPESCQSYLRMPSLSLSNSLLLPLHLPQFPFPFPLRPPSMASFPSSSPNHCCSSTSNPDPGPSQPSLLVFSGGTAFNGVVEELKNFTTCVAHVLPVSDDGGSTAEIVRVLGGPAVGDIRSRCLRLSDQSTSEALAVRRLLGHRLPLDPREAKSEWYNIVEGEHPMWKGVSKPYRETIRAFLVYFQNQILRRADDLFCFSHGSIGNFFFAGARIFFQSLDAAIFLYSRVSDIPSESLVLPVISTNDRLTLGCELMDGTIIRGQNEISHPTTGSMEPINKVRSLVPGLPSRIKRVFYMSSEGKNLLHEVFPAANPAVLEQLSNVDCIVYAMGSLFTSICPSLVLIGIGEVISSRSCPKVFLLNGTDDRETSGFSASCFVTAITDALNRTYGDHHNCLENLPSQYINTILVPRDGEIPVDVEKLAAQGILDVILVNSIHDPKVGVIFDPKSLIDALAEVMGRYMSKNDTVA